MKYLQKEFSNINFGTGVVIKKDIKKEDIKHGSIGKGLVDLGYQTDIIVYKGAPFHQIFDFVVVNLKNVLFTIEVKKWTSNPKSSTSL